MMRRVILSIVCLAAFALHGEGGITVKSARICSDGVHFTVEIGSAEGTLPAGGRALYACSGCADGGDSLSLWDHFEKIADIGADAVTGEYVVPASSFGVSIPFLRFVTVIKGLGSTDYCAHDLFAQWDGIDNATDGDRRWHSGNPLIWKDLTGHGWDGTRDSSASRWTDKSYAFSRSENKAFELPKNFQSALGASWTIEAFVKPDQANLANYSGICGGHGGVHGISFCQYEGGIYRLGTFTYPGSSGKDYANAEYSPDLLAAGVAHHIAMTVDGEAKRMIHYIDGVRQEELPLGQTELSYERFWLGRANDAVDRMFSGDIYAVRAYKTALTDEEVRANREVDLVRFTSQPPQQTASTLIQYASLQRVEVSANLLDGVVVSFDLSFGLSSGLTYDLYSACDVSDRGDATNGWASVALVRAGITAETDSLDGVPVPAGFGEEYSCLRFFFIARFDSGSYVSSGVEAQWDGIDNAGHGQHDASSQTWKDLAGDWDLTTPVAEGQLQWTDNGYRFASVNGTAFRTTGLMPSLGGSWTIEAYFRPATANEGNYHGVGGGHGTGKGLILGQYCNGDYEISCQGWADHSKNMFSVQLLPSGRDHHVAVTADADTQTGIVYIDGVAQDRFNFHSGDSLITYDTFMLGCAYSSFGTDRTFNGDINAMRIYKRALTATEVALNRHVDTVRFGGGQGGRIVSDAYSRNPVVKLKIAADSDLHGELNPAAGIYPDIYPRLPCVCTAERIFVTNSTLMECVGSTRVAAGGEPVDSDSLTVALERPDGNEDWTVTWHYRTWHTLAARAIGDGHVVLPSSAYPGFYLEGSAVVVTAVCDSAQQRFLEWVGDVAAEDAHRPVITLNMDSVKKLTAIFGPKNGNRTSVRAAWNPVDSGSADFVASHNRLSDALRASAVNSSNPMKMPGGTWRFATAGGQTLSCFDAGVSYPGLCGFNTGDLMTGPCVLVNTTGGLWSRDDCSFIFPGEVFIHPADDTQLGFCVYFTPEKDATYRFSGFARAVTAGTFNDGVKISCYLPGKDNPLAVLTTASGSHTFDCPPVALPAGREVRIVVDRQANYYSDATAFDIDIARVDRPSPLQEVSISSNVNLIAIWNHADRPIVSTVNGIEVSFGRATAVDGSFSALQRWDGVEGLAGWCNDPSKYGAYDLLPYCLQNVVAEDVRFGTDFPAHANEWMLHPGPGRYNVCRFRPKSGMRPFDADLVFRLRSLEPNPLAAGEVAYVLRNGNVLSSCLLNNGETAEIVQALPQFGPSDTVDFVMHSRYSGGASVMSDMTALSVVLRRRRSYGMVMMIR